MAKTGGEIKVKRMTRQRRVIKDILCSTKSHPTADWIYSEARKVLPDISLGTVYRNLQVLLEDGTIQELNYGKGVSRFDGNPCRHYHFVCTECGRVFDLEMPELEILQQQASQCCDGMIQDYRLEFSGVCADCLKLNKKAN